MLSAVLSRFLLFASAAYTFGLCLPCPFCPDHDMSRSPIFDTTHTRRLLAGEEFSDEELKWPGGPESLVTDDDCQSLRRATVHCDMLAILTLTLMRSLFCQYLPILSMLFCFSFLTLELRTYLVRFLGFSFCFCKAGEGWFHLGQAD